MRRRLDLAAALVHRPPVLFLDEPTTGLDPRGRSDLWAVISELVSDGTTVLLTTQYLEEAERLADDVVVIDGGKIIAHGTPHELKSTVGATIIEVRLADAAAAQRATGLLSPLGPAEVSYRRTHRGGHGARRRPGRARRGPGPRRRPAWCPSGSPSANPPWTTCSCSSPAIGPRRRPRPSPRRPRPKPPPEPAPQARCGMTTTTTPCRSPCRRTQVEVGWAVSDALTIAQRNLIALFRVPTTLVFSTIQPVIFVLMFRYVFGGAINTPGVRYVDFLMAGIFVQTVTFGSVNTGVGLAEDLSKGLIERFRSLAMARSAVLAGRTLADTLRNLMVIILMMLVGFGVGFRVHTNPIALLGAIGVMLLFGFSMSWVMANIGLRTGTAEGAQAAAFPMMAVLVFASNAFVPTATMPGPLRAYANHQPVSAAVDAVRALTIGGPTTGKLIATLAWSLGILAVFAPLAVRRYRRTA